MGHKSVREGFFFHYHLENNAPQVVLNRCPFFKTKRIKFVS